MYIVSIRFQLKFLVFRKFVLHFCFCCCCCYFFTFVIDDVAVIDVVVVIVVVTLIVDVQAFLEAPSLGDPKEASSSLSDI